MNKFVFLIILFLFSESCKSQEVLYNHILITNDDGIEDKNRLIALAKNVKKIAKKVSIIVAESDRSGSSNYSTIGKYKSQLEVTKLTFDSTAISIYTINGTPSDCVALGLNGFFKNDRPDLVLSGINGGSNSGPEWFGSGTIGAVRTAAALGVKSIAISGFDSNNKDSFELIPKWITQLISSEVMSTFHQNDYLTISFPEILDNIKGVKISERRISVEKPQFLSFEKEKTIDGEVNNNKSIWRFDFTGDPIDRTKVYDDSMILNGYIVITPMTINENNYKRIKELENIDVPEFNKN